MLLGVEVGMLCGYSNCLGFGLALDKTGGCELESVPAAILSLPSPPPPPPPNILSLRVVGTVSSALDKIKHQGLLSVGACYSHGRIFGRVKKKIYLKNFFYRFDQY